MQHGRLSHLHRWRQLFAIFLIPAMVLGPVFTASAQSLNNGANIFIPVIEAGPDERSLDESVEAAAAPVGQGFNLNASDLRFIMQQIRIAERHASTQTADNPCLTLVAQPGDGIPDEDQIPLGTGQTIELPWGLRTVDGSCNHLTPGQEVFGASSERFPRLLTMELRDAETVTIDLDGPGPLAVGDPTSYDSTGGFVFDSEPRIISNLIVDQTAGNPAAVAAAGLDAVTTASGAFFIENAAPDVGLSAPYNSWFTLFGQFFDHGLDLVNKGGVGTVFVPLQSDDPLFAISGPTPFMVLSRATHGGDHEATNQTTPWVDQGQTYTSHPSHQVFLREYTLVGGQPIGTGRLITGTGGGMATWADVKFQALTVLGIELVDTDALSIPLLATDPYGRFIRGPNGFPQIVFPGNVLVEGNLTTPITTTGSVKSGHEFLVDIAHHAFPGAGLTPDADTIIGDDGNPDTYDDELLNAHFMAGDGRVNENIGLTAVHHIFHSEHNRLTADIADKIATLPEFTQAERDAWSATNGPAGWDYGERIFQAARFVTEMEYQHLAFEEFIRKVQPMVNAFGEGGTGFHPSVNPAIRAEFAHAVYRFGHSLLTESVDRVDASGVDHSMTLLAAFLNPTAFFHTGLDPVNDPEAADKAAGAIVRGMTRQTGNEVDEFVTEALRNQLLGLPLDLATLNLARARETGVPRLNEARRQFYAATQNSALMPYTDWMDFGFSIKHPESLVNFVAAYGTHPTILAETTLAGRRAAANQIVNGTVLPGPDGILADNPETTDVDESADNILPPADRADFFNSTGAWVPVNGRTTTGVDDIDLWVGGLAEKQMVFGGILGPTFNYVFETQMEDLQDGDRFYYLSRTAGLNLLVQLEGNSFAELIQRNTDVEGLPADAFSVPAYVFNLDAQTNPTGIVDDPATTDYDETTLLVRMGNGTIRYTGPEHVVFNGTAGNDLVWSSEGDDTMRGNDGDDWMQGGDGNDNLIGGLGDDILLDSAGDDTIKGGDGNDAISSGQGFGGDLNQGGRGNDFIVGGNDDTESFGGPGNDFIFGGDGQDTIFGDDGDDWLEAGRGAFNLVQGDNGAPFQNDPNAPGHDVLIGYGGEQDYDSEGGDDIMLMGPGIQRAEGMLGFDWVTHKLDPNPGDSDMLFTALLPPTVETNRDRLDLVEAMSGWNLNDNLKGDNRTAADMTPDHVLNAAGIARISGLAALLPAGATSFAAGNIILGGDGSDILEGRGGNDIIDGDRWLDVQIQVVGDRPAGLAEFHDTMATLRAAVFAGQINPGQLQIVRTIRTPSVPAPDCGAANPLNCDTAVFSGTEAEYTVTTVNATTKIVTHNNGGIDGIDTLFNIEQLLFLGDNPTLVNALATGAVTIGGLPAIEDGQLTASISTVTDADGIANPPSNLVFNWESEIAPGVWIDTGATGATFTPTDEGLLAPNVVGQRLRVVATFVDNLGNPEFVISAPTAPVVAVNDAPTGLPILSDTTPEVGTPVTAITNLIADIDGLGTFSFQWLANGGAIAGAVGPNFTPTLAQQGQTLRVVVGYTDGQGFAEAVTSAASAPVAAAGGGAGGDVAIASLPASEDFGTRTLNTDRTRTLTVRNPGTAPLTVASVDTSGAPFINPDLGTCTAPVAPGRSCRISVTFRPTTVGDFVGTLTLLSNAVNNPTLVILTGSGRAAVGGALVGAGEDEIIDDLAPGTGDLVPEGAIFLPQLGR